MRAVHRNLIGTEAGNGRADVIRQAHNGGSRPSAQKSPIILAAPENTSGRQDTSYRKRMQACHVLYSFLARAVFAAPPWFGSRSSRTPNQSPQPGRSAKNDHRNGRGAA